MSETVYQELAQYLDHIPGGFPPTTSGAELRLLQRLFTPEEADLALYVGLTAETPQVIAQRAGLPLAETEQRLQEMAAKGLIFCYYEDDLPVTYVAIPWVLGIYEFQVGRLNMDLLRDIAAYSRETTDPESWKAEPQLRTIPINASLVVQQDVLIYEDAEALVCAQERIAVAPCICRQKAALVGSACDKPLETCLVFNEFADYYVHQGLGRAIDQVEALDIIHAADAHGLVLQPGNAKATMNICCCCGDCCGVLQTAKLHPQPATVLSSPYVAHLDLEACNDCGVCTTRCQMEAVVMGEQGIVHNEKRCIGCGLCVTSCTTGAMTLVRLPEAEQPPVPEDFLDMRFTLGRASGRLSGGEVTIIRA